MYDNKIDEQVIQYLFLTKYMARADLDDSKPFSFLLKINLIVSYDKSLTTSQRAICLLSRSSFQE